MNRSIVAAAPIAAPDRDLPANIRKGASECCRILLEHGADPYLLDDEGRSPIDLARKGHHEDVLKVLVSVYFSKFLLIHSKTKYFCSRC